MLYLTYTDFAETNGLIIVSYTYIQFSREIMLMDFPAASCIVNVDELDACAIKLKGIPMFRVTSMSNVEATVADIELVMQWFKHNWKP